MTQIRLLMVLALASACAHPMPSAATARASASVSVPATAPTPAAQFAPAPPANPLLAEISAAERAVVAHPDDAEAWGRLASALRRANRLQEAARAAWRTVELASSVESWTSLGNLFIQGGAPNGAMAAFEEVSQQTNDGFLAAQNFLNLGYHAWRWGMDDLAMRAYVRADELAPGHPLVLYDKTLLLAASGEAAKAKAEADKLRKVVDRVLQDRPPLEMVELLEPMKALVESVASGDAVARLPPQPEPGQPLPDRFFVRDPSQSPALDLAIDETSQRFYPVAGWQVLALTVPSGWSDSLDVTRGQPASARIRLEAGGPLPVLWLLTITESLETPDLDRLVTEARRALPGSPTLGEVRSFAGRGLEGRAFVADNPGARSEDRRGFPRVWVAVLRSKGFLVTATRFLRDRDPVLVEESERFVRALEVRDLTPPRH